MFIKYSIFFIVSIISLICKGTDSTFLQLKEPVMYSVQDFQIYQDTTQAGTVLTIIDEYNKGRFYDYKETSTGIPHHEIYWIRFEAFNKLPYNLTWMLEFNSQISNVWVYIMDSIGKFSGKPLSSASINNICRNKILIPLQYNKKSVIYIKIYNQVLINANLSKMELVPGQEFEKNLSLHGFLIGLLFGGYILIYIISLQICFTKRRKEYVFYSLYVAFNAIFAVFGSFITDKYLFSRDPWAAYSFYASILIAHMFYILFVRYFIEPENIPEKTDKYFFKPIMLFILIINPLVTAVSFFDIVLFKKIFDIVILTDACLGFILALTLFQIKIKPVRFILLGSFIMIIFGAISQLADVFDWTKNNYFYNTGALTELILFAYAINIKQKMIEKEKEEKERSLDRLKTKLSGQQRELTQKAIYITQTEQMLNNLKSKLQIIDSDSSKNKDILREILLDIEIYHNQNSWDDFEKYFTEVHPDFYIKLKQKYPELTSNEVRLCAMLRLTLNTKEIAVINGKTPKSIDVMRNRIRNKMKIDRNEKLYDILTTI